MRWTRSRKAKIMHSASLPRASIVVEEERRLYFADAGRRPAENVGSIFFCRQKIAASLRVIWIETIISGRKRELYWAY